MDAFWIDGEWIGWDSIPEENEEEFRQRHLARLEYEADLRQRFPNADIALIPIFQDLLGLAERYHLETGSHLQVYGDLGELFGAIQYGIKLHRNYAKGSDGRLGDDFVEIKTISPFKKSDDVTLRLDRNFNKILIVKINADFEVSGRMMARRNLPRTKGNRYRLTWQDLERHR